jgi:hypothetical protein
MANERDTHNAEIRKWLTICKKHIGMWWQRTNPAGISKNPYLFNKIMYHTAEREWVLSVIGESE